MKRAPLLATVAVAAALLGPVPPGRAVPVQDPGPFWPLVTGHEGLAYADALPGGASYSLRSGRLPQGLRLEASGRLRGTPRETGLFEPVVEALEAGGRRYPVRLSLTVRRADESDLPKATPSFEAVGPYATAREDMLVDVTSSFDGARTRTVVRLVRPAGAPGPRPLVLFHRGRGFDYDDYDRLLEHVASYGIAAASVNDERSFSGGSFQGLVRDYDLYRAELGMQSASGVLEAVADLLLDRAADPADALYGLLDPDDLFVAGHSRGGGATHASHQRSFLLRLKGLIYLMPFDLRYFAEVRPPAALPAYPIFDATPRTPSLVIAAENDGDLVYPIADQLLDRASGPATQVTLYGAVHNLISDAHPPEGRARIGRTTQRRRVADWIVCFVRRWAEGEVALDRRLYVGGHQGDATAAVSAWEPAARTLLVEDAQDADPDRNLRGRNFVSSLRRREASYYPLLGDFGSLGLRHTLLTPTDSVSAWRMASDGPLDVTDRSRLVLRLAQSSTGWGWVGVWVRLIDDRGGSGWAQVWEPSRGGSLPADDGLSPHDRLVDVHVPLGAVAPDPAAPLDPSRVAGVDLFLVLRRSASTTRHVAVDAVRFE